MNIDFDLIKDEAKKFFLDVQASHEWEHTERVYQNCLNLGGKDADLDVLKVSAWLHDIGRKWQDESGGTVCHAKKGALLAKEILERFDLDEEYINAVMHCIKCHRASDNASMPESIEAKILYDADNLDNLGAIGVGRGFMFASEIGAKFHDSNVDLEITSPYTKDDTAYRYFLESQSKIRNKMITEKGKQLAEKRFTFMSDFFDELNKEVVGER